MKLLKMNWVKTPYIRNGAVGYQALVSFDFSAEKEIVRYATDKEITGYANPTLEGYIQKDGKKIAVYDSSIVGILTDVKHLVLLDGVDIKRTGKYLPEDLIEQSEKSSNNRVAHLAQLWKRILAHKNHDAYFKKELDALFDNKPFVRLTTKKIPEDIKLETLKIGTKEYIFDFNYGVEKSVTWDEPSHEHFVPAELFRSISKDKIPALQELLEKNKTLPSLPKYDESEQWQSGFDKESFETKKQMAFKY